MLLCPERKKKREGRTGKLWPGTWAKYHSQRLWVVRDAKRAGLGLGVTFHSLRAFFVTDRIRAGADIDEVRKLARHKSVTTTLKHYARTDLKRLHTAVNKKAKQPRK